MVGENAFFREATLRICSSLDIGEALHACHAYFARHMPIDQIFLERHSEDLEGIEIVAEASATTGLKTGLRIPLPASFRETLREIERQHLAGAAPPVVILNRPSQDPLSLHVLQAIGAPLSSYMGLPLIVGGRLVGALGAIAEGEDRFDDSHARLFATLKEPFFVAMSNALQHEQAISLKNRLAEENQELHRALRQSVGEQIVGADFGLREVIRQVRQVAATETPVLITGETGVGKDLIASAIHLASRRSGGPFVPVNCGAIPAALLDSELFGHEKGAFTGALARRLGRFERAHKGTILLDEIGEMPLEAQVRLLRVLQNREIERVGGTERIPVDIRIIAATNRDLPRMVAEGGFREDLLFRLAVVPIAVPPLRDRAGDLPALVRFFIKRKTGELKLAQMPTLAEEAIGQLMAYDWPGNVRELENVIERAMILNPDGPLRFSGLGSPTGADTGASAGSGTARTPRHDADRRDMNLDRAVADHLRRVLAMTEGKLHGPGGAAERLGVNPNTLRYRLSKLGIPAGRDWRKADARS